MRKLKLIVLFLFSGIVISVAQPRQTKNLSDKEHKVLAEKMIEKGGYYGAAAHLEDVIRKEPNNKLLTLKLGESYYYSRDYKQGEEWLKKAKENDPKLITNATYFYAECLKYNGKYEEARENYILFSNSKYKERSGEKLKVFARNQILSCEYAIKKQGSSNAVDLIHLGDSINSGYTEFAPRLKNDSTLIFASLQSDSVITVAHEDVHFEHTKLYMTGYNKEAGHWSRPEELKKLNSKFENTANGSYSVDGKKFYFTRCYQSDDHKMICRIYVSEVENGEFKKPKKLSSDINQEGVTSTMPALSKVKVGKEDREILYFVSDRKSGKGGMDLWYTVIKKDGTFSKPQNCGKDINTMGDEISPYFDSESGIMYFSSNFHEGFGGFDVFKTAGAAGRWERPQNIGKPVNSSWDDTYYTLGHNKFNGFLVSNRPGGMHMLSETCCDDIYGVKYKEPMILTVNVIDSLSGKKMEKPNLLALTSFVENESDTSFNIKGAYDYDTLNTASDSTLLNSMRIPEKIENYYVIEPGKDLSFEVSEKGFEPTKIVLSYPNENNLVSKSENVSYKLKKSPNRNLYQLDIFLQEARIKDTLKPIEIKQDTNVIKSTLKEVYLAMKTPQPVEDSTLKIKTKKKSIEFDLNLTFEYNRFDLNAKNQAILDSVYDIVQDAAQMRFRISTHTDNIGSDDYNQLLSDKRAAFIASYFLKRGINKSRIEAKGFGELKPVAANSNPDGTDYPEGRQKNRRTEIRFLRE